MPSLIRLYEEFKDSGFVVLAISSREERGVVEKYARKQRMPFPVLLDTSGEVAFSYGAQATPTHYLINRKGEAVALVRGARDWTDAASRNLIRFFLDQK